MRTVLFVCHANTCRSVMAQVLLARMLEERSVSDRIRVASGGVGNVARDGMISSLDARIVLREEGIHLGETAIVSTDLREHPEVVAGADLILTMTAAQKGAVAALAGYRACRDEIKRCLKLSLGRLLVTLSP